MTTHTFHIPVMGTGFTIDTPLKVARYGISSVISLVDDVLIEQMRKHHATQAGEPYEEIRPTDHDSRARRITAYLNLLDLLIKRQVAALQESPFDPGSEITRYYELLPDSGLKARYLEMLDCADAAKKSSLQAELRRNAVPGTIDVNIMTKLDRLPQRAGQSLPPEFSDALTALRGYANSVVQSGIVLSAGLNQRLYSYMAQFEDFFQDQAGRFPKEIILKVSDYRSAEIQGKFLAKRGLWVSEYRIESGLNCGGHAFANKGHLMGPILEEFLLKRDELRQTLSVEYAKALAAGNKRAIQYPLNMRVTAQGGVGTADEHSFLLKRYALDSVGWGTPFMLVPEATNVDDEHLRKLCEAGQNDVYLSDSSPLGVPFWNLRTSGSEHARMERIEEGSPGSLCPKGFLANDTELSPSPLCKASKAYQKLKIRKIHESDALDEQKMVLMDKVLVKSCICHDLAGGVAIKCGFDPLAQPSVCCGPNIVNFSRISTLKEMIDHIYGRGSVLSAPNRPHMFIRELELYMDYLHKELKEFQTGLSARKPEYFEEYRENLRHGIEYYKTLASEIGESASQRFLEQLSVINAQLQPATV